MSSSIPLAESSGRVPSTGPFLCFLVVFALLAVLRSEVLFSPPYYDYAVGIWAEADYLTRSNFDYLRLCFAEPHCLDPDGGPRSYMTSVIPTLLAIVMMFSPGPKFTIFTYHMFVLACGSATSVMLFLLLRRNSSRSGAIWGTFAAIATPVLCVQLDMTSMEIPLVAASVASALAFQREAYVMAAILGLLAFFIKPAGICLTLAGGGVLVLLATLDRSKSPRIWAGIAAHAWAFIIEVFVIDIGGSLAAQVRASINWSMLWVWCPDWVVLCMTVSVIGLGLLIGLCVQSFKEQPSALAPGLIRRLVLADPFLLFIIVATAGFVVASTRVSLVPRYLAVTVPFLFVLANAILQKTGERWKVPLWISLSIFHCLNWNGVFYPDLTTATEQATGVPGPFFAGEGSFLERSHEYLADHQANIQAINILSKHAKDDDAVLAPIPFAYFLAYPSFGYIDRPLRGYTTNGFKKTAPWYGDYQDFLRDRPTRVIVMRCANFYSNARLLIDMPWPRTEDEILFQSTAGDVMVFRVELPRASKGHDDWYKQLSIPRTRAASMIYHALQTGGVQAALHATAQWQREYPADSDIQAIAQAFSLRAGEPIQPSTMPNTWGLLRHERVPPKGSQPMTHYDRDIQRSQASDDPNWESGWTSLRHLDLSSAAGYFAYLVEKRKTK